MSYRALLGDFLKRKLQPGEPSTFIEGGGSPDRSTFQPTDRQRERLEKFEAAYEQGGPVAQLVDTRALMTFGTGSEFISDAELMATVDDVEMTVADWLAEMLPQRDNLFVRLGRDNYIYGDAFGELVETRGGEFSHIVLVNPKTLEPEWNDQGTVQKWVQTIQPKGAGMRGELQQAFDPEEIGHVALQRLGRHPLGISLIERNWEEIQRFSQNQHSIAQSLQRHGHTKWWVKVGREGTAAAIDDNEMRRVRQRFRQVQGNDAIATGADIEINPLDTGGAIGEGIGSIAENDLTMLAAGFGVPEEMAGLGRGSTEATAKVRLQAFERTARAEQRALADQFIEEFVRPLLAEYSPFPRDIDIGLEFDDVVSDQQATAEWLRDFKGIYTADEMRNKLGDGAIPDDVDVDDLGVPGGEGETPGRSPFEMGGTHTPARTLASAGYAPWEQAWHRVYEDVLWADDSRQLFEFDAEEVPEFVKERLQAVIREEGVFADFETVPDSARATLQDALLDSLEEQHGWSVTSLRTNLQAAVPALSDVEAERIARTETQHLVNQAREEGYREQFGDEARFDWVGPADGRTTEACAWIKDQIDGRSGVSLAELKSLVQEANDRFIDHAARELMPHISCRHTFVRVV